MEAKELFELAKNSDCTKEKELSKLMTSSKDGSNGELMNCREANELPKLPTNSNLDPNFCPVASATSKKSSKKKKKKKKEQMVLQKQSHPLDPLVAENKLPVLSSEPKTEPTGWPEFPLKALRTPLSMEEQARAAPSRLQQNGVRALHNFLKKDDSSNNASYDDDDEREEETFQFLLGLFDRETGLRIYYEKNYSNGEFYCLMCRGIGVKMGKTYRDCVGIVQHSTSSLKKWRKAHRGFGRAVCRVLGWSIGKLPNIVQDLGGSLGQFPVKPAAPQVIFLVLVSFFMGNVTVIICYLWVSTKVCVLHNKMLALNQFKICSSFTGSCSLTIKRVVSKRKCLLGHSRIFPSPAQLTNVPSISQHNMASFRS